MITDRELLLIVYGVIRVLSDCEDSLKPLVKDMEQHLGLYENKPVQRSSKIKPLVYPDEGLDD